MSVDEIIRDNRSPERVLGDKMRENGALLEGEPILDGQWHRTAVATDTGNKKSGTYRGFADGRPNCSFHNKKTGEFYRFKAVYQDQYRAVHNQTHTTGPSREAELAAKRQAAAKTAYGVWKNTHEWANQSNSGYLRAKGVRGHGVKLDREDNVLIPLRDVSGFMHSMQIITPEHQKIFLKGGQIKGMMHLIDPKRALGDSSDIVIAEGYATAATVHQATQLPVAVAFNADNLEKVAVALKGKYPEARLIIAADNDHKHAQSPQGNVGLCAARDAAQAVKGRIMAPDFSKAEQERGLSDWNDMHQSRGLTQTTEAMRHALKVATKSTTQSRTKFKSRTTDQELGMGM